MPVLFPALRPTERDYRPPSFPVSATRSQSGVVSKRLWGSIPGDAELRLGFRIITTDTAADIVNAWTATKSGIDFLILPSSILSGVGPRLSQVILPSSGTLRWTFAEAPEIGFVGPVWSSAQVRLVGEVRLN